MNNIKKIGLTALAGSLVATSVAYAGALEATGAAEMKMTNHSQMLQEKLLEWETVSTLQVLEKQTAD